MRRLGELSQPFDFSIDGVTTISADMHKYGYAPKNASVLLYRNRELRGCAFFVCSATTEYAVINPTVLSSKSAGPIAASWAIMRHLGEEGYERIVRETWEATRAMLDGIERIDGIDVLAQPDMCMFTLGSTEINIFELDDEMQARGWSLLPQFACGGGPANLHVSVSMSNVPLVDRFLIDLRESVEQLRARGTSIDREALAREVDAIKDRPLGEVFARLAQLAGLGTEGLPERLGLMNTILDLLPAARRDEILAAYINAL
jgi:glutamate/tyrosine decarboxylase-like PLP-dependent enzyme